MHSHHTDRDNFNSTFYGYQWLDCGGVTSLEHNDCTDAESYNIYLYFIPSYHLRVLTLTF